MNRTHGLRFLLLGTTFAAFAPIVHGMEAPFPPLKDKLTLDLEQKKRAQDIYDEWYKTGRELPTTNGIPKNHSEVLMKYKGKIQTLVPQPEFVDLLARVRTAVHVPYDTGLSEDRLEELGRLYLLENILKAAKGGSIDLAWIRNNIANQLKPADADFRQKRDKDWVPNDALSALGVLIAATGLRVFD